jgi:hypothetical protein
VAQGCKSQLCVCVQAEAINAACFASLGLHDAQAEQLVNAHQVWKQRKAAVAAHWAATAAKLQTDMRRQYGPLATAGTLAHDTCMLPWHVYKRSILFRIATDFASSLMQMCSMLAVRPVLLRGAALKATLTCHSKCPSEQ